ncbi:uncharacterized protein MONBRDRAFT_10393 [Monosiga brevicollis MX1]|uniref:BRCA2 OB1 domain-containing protein n=1 Tax=Monosiga brevicollis TaxID=81824 RepID=A9V630_MONBE|nr:uncharacterized protein MONBRDRAFT_10393 [Monosiga brevicollis MX1]EDQ87001.1 predicted protein [Monosiga brevicollis MX1]|eukprot:XP_001748240.1 hypothetical protein [Monosiga brevicollis MX1]
MGSQQDLMVKTNEAAQQWCQEVLRGMGMRESASPGPHNRVAPLRSFSRGRWRVDPGPQHSPSPSEPLGSKAGAPAPTTPAPMLHGSIDPISSTPREQATLPVASSFTTPVLFRHAPLDPTMRRNRQAQESLAATPANMTPGSTPRATQAPSPEDPTPLHHRRLSSIILDGYGSEHSPDPMHRPFELPANFDEFSPSLLTPTGPNRRSPGARRPPRLELGPPMPLEEHGQPQAKQSKLDVSPGPRSPLQNLQPKSAPSSSPNQEQPGDADGASQETETGSPISSGPLLLEFRNARTHQVSARTNRVVSTEADAAKGRALLAAAQHDAPDAETAAVPDEPSTPAFVGFQSARTNRVVSTEADAAKGRALLAAAQHDAPDAETAAVPDEPSTPAFVGFQSARTNRVVSTEADAAKGRALLAAAQHDAPDAPDAETAAVPDEPLGIMPRLPASLHQPVVSSAVASAGSDQYAQHAHLLPALHDNDNDKSNTKPHIDLARANHAVATTRRTTAGPPENDPACLGFQNLRSNTIISSARHATHGRALLADATTKQSNLRNDGHLNKQAHDHEDIEPPRKVPVWAPTETPISFVPPRPSDGNTTAKQPRLQLLDQHPPASTRPSPGVNAASAPETPSFSVPRTLANPAPGSTTTSPLSSPSSLRRRPPTVTSFATPRANVAASIKTAHGETPSHGIGAALTPKNHHPRPAAFVTPARTGRKAHTPGLMASSKRRAANAPSTPGFGTRAKPKGYRPYKPPRISVGGAASEAANSPSHPQTPLTPQPSSSRGLDVTPAKSSNSTTTSVTPLTRKEDAQFFALCASWWQQAPLRLVPATSSPRWDKETLGDTLVDLGFSTSSLRYSPTPSASDGHIDGNGDATTPVPLRETLRRALVEFARDPSSTLKPVSSSDPASTEATLRLTARQIVELWRLIPALARCTLTKADWLLNAACLGLWSHGSILACWEPLTAFVGALAHREHYANVRPALRQICEEDRHVALPFTCTVLDVAPNNGYVWICDGTYPLRARPDPALQASWSKSYGGGWQGLIGGGLAVINAALQSPGPHPPLDDAESTQLTLYCNSTRGLEDASVEDFVSVAPDWQPPAFDWSVTPISDIVPDGGAVPLVEAFVERVLPTVYRVTDDLHSDFLGLGALHRMRDFFERRCQEAQDELEKQALKQAEAVIQRCSLPGTGSTHNDEQLAAFLVADRAADLASVPTARLEAARAEHMAQLQARVDQARHLAAQRMRAEQGFDMLTDPVALTQVQLRCRTNGSRALLSVWRDALGLDDQANGALLCLRNVVPKVRNDQLTLAKAKTTAIQLRADERDPALGRALTPARFLFRTAAFEYVDILGKVLSIDTPLGSGVSALQRLELADAEGHQFVLQCHGSLAFHGVDIEAGPRAWCWEHVRVLPDVSDRGLPVCEFTGCSRVSSLQQRPCRAFLGALEAFQGALDNFSWQIQPLPPKAAPPNSSPHGSPLRAGVRARHPTGSAAREAGTASLSAENRSAGGTELRMVLLPFPQANFILQLQGTCMRFEKGTEVGQSVEVLALDWGPVPTEPPPATAPVTHAVASSSPQATDAPLESEEGACPICQSVFPLGELAEHCDACVDNAGRTLRSGRRRRTPSLSREGSSSSSSSSTRGSRSRRVTPNATRETVPTSFEGPAASVDVAAEPVTGHAAPAAKSAESAQPAIITIRASCAIHALHLPDPDVASDGFAGRACQLDGSGRMSAQLSWTELALIAQYRCAHDHRVRRHRIELAELLGVHPETALLNLLRRLLDCHDTDSVRLRLRVPSGRWALNHVFPERSCILVSPHFLLPKFAWG